MVPDASIAFAAVTLTASNAEGRPPMRPRAQPAATAVRGARAEAPPQTAEECRRCGGSNRPVALVVSMASCIGLRPMPRVAKVSTVLRSRRMDRQTVGNDQHIAVASFQGGSKLAGVARCMWPRWPLAIEINLKVTLARRTAPSQFAASPPTWATTNQWRRK